MTEPFDYWKQYEPEALPDAIAFPLVVTYCISGYAQGRVSCLTSYDHAGDKDNIVIVRTTCTIQLDKSKNIRQVALDSLHETLKEIQAKAWKETQEVQARIDKLLQLEYQPSKENLNEF